MYTSKENLKKELETFKVWSKSFDTFLKVGLDLEGEIMQTMFDMYEKCVRNLEYDYEVEGGEEISDFVFEYRFGEDLRDIVVKDSDGHRKKYTVYDIDSFVEYFYTEFMR